MRDEPERDELLKILPKCLKAIGDTEKGEPLLKNPLEQMQAANADLRGRFQGEVHREAVAVQIDLLDMHPVARWIILNFHAARDGQVVRMRSCVYCPLIEVIIDLGQPLIVLLDAVADFAMLESPAECCFLIVAFALVEPDVAKAAVVVNVEAISGILDAQPRRSEALHHLRTHHQPARRTIRRM